MPFLPRYSPDYSGLSAIYQRGGDQLAQLALQRGAAQAATLDRLASIFSGYQEINRQKKATAAATALRAQERAEDRGEKQKDRDERAAERKSDADRAQRAEDRAAARWMVDNTSAGPMSRVAADLAMRFPETAARFSPQMTLPARPVPGAAGEMSSLPAPTGQVVLHQSPDDARADEQLAAQRGRWAAEDARAKVDDDRMERSLKATIDNQDAMRRIAQQNADTSRINANTTRQRYTGSGLDSTMPAPLLNALDRSILTITSTKRGPIVSLANRLWSEGNDAELKNVIKQAAIEGENVDTKNQVLGRQATIAALADARTILQEMKTAGVPTNILSGSAEDIARKLGTSTNPKYVEFANELQDAVISYRRAATGVAFGVEEGREYARMFPNYRQTMPVNEAAITGMERAMRTHDQAYWTHKLGPDGAALILGTSAATPRGNAAPVKVLSIVPVPRPK